MSSKYEKKGGKYYVYINGVRHQVSKETYIQSQEEDRQEKISKMTEKDRKKREKTKQKGYYVESKKNTIRLTESDLKKVIAESVKRVLKEGDGNISHEYNDEDDYIYAENPYAHLDENEQKCVKKIEDAINAIDWVLHDLNKGDEHINGASELVGMVHDARVLMACAKYGILASQVPTRWLLDAFGDAARKYIQ